MKHVNLPRTSEHVSKQSFFKLTKNSILHNSKEHPNIEFMKNCIKKEVVPAPIFAKISQGKLNLTGYSLSSGQAQALEIFLK